MQYFNPVRPYRRGTYEGEFLANITITITSFMADAELIFSLRKSVFIDEQGVPEDIEIDGLDPVCRHVLAWREGVAVGTGRISPDGRIGRMAVLKSSRGQGIGRDLLIELVRLGREAGIDQLHLSAQCRAIPFYEKAGFVVSGPVYKEAGIEHRHMTLPPTMDVSGHGAG